ncbi:MAG: polymerase [Frankiales bacterium]|nr:polymerase [Frankiales bacterium]
MTIPLRGLRARPGRASESGPESAAGGDDIASAIEELVNEHGRALLTFTQRLTGDRFAAEDVVQETLLRAWQRPEVMTNGRGSMRGWLLTVARNIVIDQARASKARAIEVGEEKVVEPHVADHAEQTVTNLDMLDLLDELTVEQRQVLVELYYRGSTVNEAAEHLGIPPGTVKSRSYYALRALRRRIPNTVTV